MRKNVREMVTAAVCLALCLLLPFLTGQIPQWGNMLSPMHIPVLLCGLLCGWPYATLVGFIAPALMLDLAVYCRSASMLRGALPMRPAYLYVSLILAMLLGRVAWGAARLALAGLNNGVFTFAEFLAGAFTSAIPGIICHILIIPPLVMALERVRGRAAA